MKEIKQIDLGQSVYEICKTYPEVKGILADIGFTEITKPGMLHTAGRLMTIPKGARMKGVELNLIIDKLREGGFEPMEGEKS